jgi:hypothetical protein
MTVPRAMFIESEETLMLLFRQEGIPPHSRLDDAVLEEVERDIAEELSLLDVEGSSAVRSLGGRPRCRPRGVGGINRFQ